MSHSSESKKSNLRTTKTEEEFYKVDSILVFLTMLYYFIDCVMSIGINGQSERLWNKTVVVCRKMPTWVSWLLIQSEPERSASALVHMLARGPKWASCEEWRFMSFRKAKFEHALKSYINCTYYCYLYFFLLTIKSWS